jgi:putative SOS response-associated peptidase YedK
MCTRYITPDQAEIERFWEISHRNQPRWWEPAIFPRGHGPFIRAVAEDRELVVGQWGLIPWFAESTKLTYSTTDARFEGIESKAAFKRSWGQGRRCIIPALSFDEPCWETGQNVWWRFSRADGLPWGLAGLWNTWTDNATGEIVESYTLLTINADDHPLMSRMHKPDPKQLADLQDKRSVVAIESASIDQWLNGSTGDAATLIKAPPIDSIEAGPITRISSSTTLTT